MKTFASFSLLLLSFFVANGQRTTKNFVIPLPEQQVEGALYRSVQLVDMREDTSHCGIVQLGAFNRKAWLIPEQPLSLQMAGLVNTLTGNQEAGGSLLLLLRKPFPRKDVVALFAAGVLLVFGFPIFSSIV